MTLNVRNLQSAQLTGETKFNNWHEKYQAQWEKPQAELVMASFWKELSPEVKAELSKRVPEAVKDMNKRYGEKNG